MRLLSIVALVLFIANSVPWLILSVVGYPRQARPFGLIALACAAVATISGLLPIP